MANTVTSLPSSSSSVTPTPDSWWLKCPEDPSLNTEVRAIGWSVTQRRPVAEFEPKGRTRAVVLRGPVMGEKGTLNLRTLSTAERLAVREILDAQMTMLLQNVLAEQWYVEVAGDIGRNQVRAATEDSKPVRDFYEWQVPLVEVDVP